MRCLKGEYNTCLLENYYSDVALPNQKDALEEPYLCDIQKEQRPSKTLIYQVPVSNDIQWLLKEVAKELETIQSPLQFQVELVVEEIALNICSYAFPDDAAKEFQTFHLRMDLSDDEAYIEFIDSGKPFNPLTASPPDQTVPLADWAIGGLGLKLVKDQAKKCNYEYRDEQNHFEVLLCCRND